MPVLSMDSSSVRSVYVARSTCAGFSIVDRNSVNVTPVPPVL